MDDDVGRQERWRSGKLFGAWVAPRPSMWRMEPATHQPLRTSAHHQIADRNGLYQPLRDSLSSYADEHAIALVPGYRDNTFRP